jgi:hypothetical protein
MDFTLIIAMSAVLGPECEIVLLLHKISTKQSLGLKDDFYHLVRVLFASFMEQSAAKSRLHRLQKKVYKPFHFCLRSLSLQQ